MASDWESMAMNVDYFGMGIGAEAAPYYGNGEAAPVAPAYYDYHTFQNTDHSLHVDELLDFSNHELVPNSAATADAQFFASPSADHQPAGSGVFAADQFSTQCSSFDLYVPPEDAAELEWLSNFVDDSFSDIPYQSMNMMAPPKQPQIEQSAAAASRGARSKRSRAGAGNAPAHPWSSLMNSSSQSPPSSSSSSSSEISNTNRGKIKGGGGMEGGVRRCTHCASEKTPQWRTGPMGPKTLCNACGVRYKSGRLVPEYRPAASPTFVLTQHSNSHRKVMELRRQKEHLMINNVAASTAGVARGVRPEMIFSDYGVC